MFPHLRYYSFAVKLILSLLEQMKFDKPTHIQRAAIPPLLLGKDV